MLMPGTKAKQFALSFFLNSLRAVNYGIIAYKLIKTFKPITDAMCAFYQNYECSIEKNPSNVFSWLSHLKEHEIMSASASRTIDTVGAFIPFGIHFIKRISLKANQHENSQEMSIKENSQAFMIASILNIANSFYYSYKAHNYEQNDYLPLKKNIDKAYAQFKIGEDLSREQMEELKSFISARENINYELLTPEKILKPLIALAITLTGCNQQDSAIDILDKIGTSISVIATTWINYSIADLKTYRELDLLTSQAKEILAAAVSDTLIIKSYENIEKNENIHPEQQYCSYNKSNAIILGDDICSSSALLFE